MHPFQSFRHPSKQHSEHLFKFPKSKFQALFRNNHSRYFPRDPTGENSRYQSRIHSKLQFIVLIPAAIRFAPHTTESSVWNGAWIYRKWTRHQIPPQQCFWNVPTRMKLNFRAAKKRTAHLIYFPTRRPRLQFSWTLQRETNSRSSASSSERSGFFLNILVVVIIALYRPMHKQLTNIIIANQSAMDAVFAVVLVVGTYYQPDPTKILVKGNVADEILCRVWYTKTPLWGMLISTTYGIVLLTFDRYLAVVYPIVYKTKIAKNKILRIAVLTTLWFLGPSLHSCFMIPLGNITSDHTCNLYSWPNKMVSQIVGLCSVTIQYFFPLGVFIFCYSRMALVLHRRVEQARESGGHTTRNETMARARSNVLQDHGTCFTPVRLLLDDESNVLVPSSIWASTSPPTRTSTTPTVAMIFINCCTSPIIYIVKYESFQKGIKHVFHCNRIHPTKWCSTTNTTHRNLICDTRGNFVKFTTITTWLHLLLYMRTSGEKYNPWLRQNSFEWHFNSFFCRGTFYTTSPQG